MRNGEAVLYVCPYCKDGRFTDRYAGFNMAVEHIRTKHPNRVRPVEVVNTSTDRKKDPLLSEREF